MLLMSYFQELVAIVVSGDIIIKLSKDIYKTREKQKTRKGLLKLNWTNFKLSYLGREKEDNQQYQDFFLKQQNIKK